MLTIVIHLGNPNQNYSEIGTISHQLGWLTASLMAQTVKNPHAMWETWVGKVPWRRAWQPTPVFLPGESPWTEEPGGLQSMESQTIRHD